MNIQSVTVGNSVSESQVFTLNKVLGLELRVGLSSYITFIVP